MAAADYHQEEFDDQFLTCAICKDIFQDPRVLPCLHTFCTTCLEGLTPTHDKLTCPIDREQVRLHGKGVGGLPRNFYVNNLLDFRNLQNSKRARVSCQMCESAATIEGTCGDCRFLLCKNCITAHGNIPTLKDHYIITLNDLKNPSSRKKYTLAKYCPRHIDQRLTFYCQPCAKLVCQACTVDEHRYRPGQDHDPREVSNVAQEVKTELQALVGQTQVTVEALKKTDGTVTMEITSITADCEREEKRIQEHFSQLRTKLDEEEKKLQHKLGEMVATQTEPLLKEKEVLEETLRSTEEGLKFCTDILARGEDVEILTLRQQLEGRLRSFTATNISHRALDKDIIFHPNLEMFTFNLGALSLCDKDIIVTEMPVESLPTNIIFRPINLKENQVQGTPQITVTSLGEQFATLDTTETSEGVFEAVWRPKTSGRHVVGVIAGGGSARGGATGDGAIGEGGNLCSPLTVDVGSNNPVLRFGQEGSQEGQFDSPEDVAVRGDRLYVADYENKRVQVFDLSGNFCYSFPTSDEPAAIVAQTDGTIVVCIDAEVMRFSPSGELILNRFPLDEYCKFPYSLAVQRDGRVVVADKDEHSIFLFEADGTLVKQVGGQGKSDDEEEDGEGEGDVEGDEVEFDEPHFVCVDKEDNIIVSDTNNHRVQVFDKNLNFRHNFGQYGGEPQDMWCPMGVSADSRGDIVLANIGGKTDGVEHSVKLQVFNPDGTWVSTISSDGDKLNLPRGVAVTEDGHVFLADSKNHCIKKYKYM
ncbi:E3 ubiquitin-protein ligase TRIM71-like [Branchiostoma floridae x Branchiostoma japonicum]